MVATVQGVRQQDAQQQVTGQVPYALNRMLPGMVHARRVRSPYVHANDARVGGQNSVNRLRYGRALLTGLARGARW
jgi:hypothetical protein